ncbi:EAL domain-containing protein [Bradyrhizobium sp. U87765 SZCCT0131]|uniref:EAL domain-containing response regulator n=1 Tax=unclassified Bradyrhizobium TaxID=2631580 RepID=UPI001BAC309D|nr:MULTISPECIES: EAL domain-containing protein [unclassified Bradyrhizobium]MBR1221060.1 EAL domain-containing protein [Bradyrhizobium sp. U87765 SZCCT0131]MBR1260120.1 EAL domain-containing protein [Bradyrhizobium sp. U87765 SZCCT0134]MBR1307631.1 EAL domain-containing protein [Bradyrhizobium sp. U87765 SZCCT0110]MBR1321585.1 EAL domain-containing protein [Bradyrhizobium sp. U87765 SZCCT0109]MBR1349898.1 EAL domain-containing protein [Bradyrhizobium sp. U87765 SZCCT0048]
MQNQHSERPSRFVAFGRRKIASSVCIVDGKQHIRTFLADTLEELGLLTCGARDADELGTRLDQQHVDAVLLGLSAGGVAAGDVLAVLAEKAFDGQVLPIGPAGSPAVEAIQQLGAELGLVMLPTLTTPFGTDRLRASVAAMMPAEGPPSAPVDVAEALKSGWLELWYQHKVDARTLVSRGAEALVRMRHPSWGVVPPAYFIPAEGDPHFRSLSEFVIGRALDDWQYFLSQSGPVDLSINLPAAFLTDATAVEQLCLQMPRHPAFSGLMIEISGSDTVRNLDMLLEVARRVRFHNIALSIDDIGADWPDLMGIDRFPFTELKVDRSLITGCADDRLKRSVCRRIVELANGYGARTVAAGVETRADLMAVHEMGFDLAQGFLFGRPAAPRKFARATLGRPLAVASA